MAEEERLPVRSPQRSTVLPVLLLALGCTASPPSSSSGAAEGAVASPSPDEPAPPVDLARLEGVWAREDGPRYELVLVDGRLLGQRLNDDEAGDERGCRVAIVVEQDLLRGEATFTRTRDEGGLLRTRWELRQVGEGRLAGRVEGVDLDEDDQEVARTWELHTFSREGPLAPEAAEAARRVLAAQLLLDAALAEGSQEALLAVFTAPEVRALEREVPGRERVGTRLVSLAARLRATEPRDPAATSLSAGASRGERGAAELAPLPLHPWVPLVIDAPAGAEVVGSEGAASIGHEPGFALNVVADEECGRGQDMIPGPFREQVLEVLAESAQEVLYLQDVDGARGYALELRVTLGGRVYHAFSDRFTAFSREEVEAMRAAARSLRLAPGAEQASGEAATGEAATGEPDMPAFLALFDGTAAGVEAALEAFGRPGLERQGMDWYDLREPQVTGEERQGARVRTTLEAKAGITLRTYTLVWEGARIVEVIDGGMR